MTRTGMVMGTPHYMSPEQTDGHADIWSDIYSMGIVLYQMLAGDLPFSGETPWEIIRLHRKAKPTSLRRAMPDLPRGLNAVVGRCLEKDPNRRYQTPALMVQALQQVMPSIVIPAPQPQTIPQAPPPRAAPPTTPVALPRLAAPPPRPSNNHTGVGSEVAHTYRTTPSALRAATSPAE